MSDDTKGFLILCITFLIFCFTIWPTLYRYDKISGKGFTYPVRINRITGDAAHYDYSGWVRHEEEKKKEEKPITVMKYEETKKITGKAGINNSQFHGVIHNGTNWIIKSILFNIKANNDEKEYEHAFNLQPFSASAFSIPIIDPGTDEFSWNITTVFGYWKDREIKE